MSDIYESHDDDIVSISVADEVREDAQLLSTVLYQLRAAAYPPAAQKTMRTYQPNEAAKILGVRPHNLRTVDESLFREFSRDDRNNRAYTVENLFELRTHFANSNLASNMPNILPTRKRGDKLQVVSVANFKGGSAKTTTSLHLAQFLALQGLRVLAIDLDPQGSLTSMFGKQPELDIADNSSLLGAIRYDDERVPIKQLIQKTYFHNLDLIPASLELMEFEHQVPTAINSGIAAGEEAFFRMIHNALMTVEDDYDVVLFDAPPQLGFLTLGALFASTGLLVTVHPAMIDVSSMSQFLNMLTDLISVIEENGGKVNLDFRRYLFTRHNPHDHPQIECASLMRSVFRSNVLANSVLETTAIANAGIEKKSLYEIERGNIGKQTLDRALESINLVNQELYDLMLSVWGR